MIEIIATEDDDPKFVELASRILNGAVNSSTPAEIYIVRIDGWFDHKWEFFAAVIGLQLGVWRWDSLRLPPFNPNRVKEQRYFRLNEQGNSGYSLQDAPALHINQSSSDNLKKRLNDIVDSALFFWYGSGTNKFDRSSMMVYSIQGQQESAWYASFLKNIEWKVNKTKGISRRELEGLLNL